MTNVQKLDFLAIFLYALPINCVTTGARELNGIYQILAGSHNSKRPRCDIVRSRENVRTCYVFGGYVNEVGGDSYRLISGTDSESVCVVGLAYKVCLAYLYKHHVFIGYCHVCLM